MDIWYALIFLAGLLCAWLLFQRFAEMEPGADKEEDDGTGILPAMYLHQLDPDLKEVGKTFALKDTIMEEDGYTISGSHCKQGMILLSRKYQEARFVSAEHATVFKDADGCYYIQDNDSSNGTKLPGSAKRERKILIDNGTIVYLGIQPIQFVFADNIGKEKPAEQNFSGVQSHVRKKPVRRNPPSYSNE